MNLQEYMHPVKAKPEDLSRVYKLLEICNLPGDDLTKEHLRHFFTVKLDGDLIGTVGLEVYADNGLLRSLAVRQVYRGKGVGKLLVRQIESHAGALGLNEIYLLTTTADSFFQNLGYERVPRKEVPESILQSEQFAELCPSSAVSMKKAIGPGLSTSTNFN